MYYRSFVGREVCTDKHGRIIYDVPVEFVRTSLREPRPQVSSRYLFERKMKELNEEYKALCVLERLSIPVDLHMAVVNRIQDIWESQGFCGRGGSD